MTVKARTQFILDVMLFGLFGFLVASAVWVEIQERHNPQDYEHWLHMHAAGGFITSLVVMVHLVFHWSWIKLQIKRRLGMAGHAG
ncbi:MAG TPA: hypothetical protein VHP83_25285 [Aggregatilineaceae bacterium]|nr:hypothetical protein [Aggregatilineaceae bacterium]